MEHSQRCAKPCRLHHIRYNIRIGYCVIITPVPMPGTNGTRRKYLSLLAAALIVAAGTVLYFVDPVGTAWAPKCMFRTIIGWQCPGCGISRATHALLHGHFAEALAYNYFFVVSIPYFFAVCAVIYIPALRRRARLYRAVTGPVPAWTYVTLFCSWWVVRNLLSI